MSIEISAEDMDIAEALVAEGRYASVNEVVRAGLHVLQLRDWDIEWTPELRAWSDALVDRSDIGLATDEQVDALLAEYQVKSA